MGRPAVVRFGAVIALGACRRPAERHRGAATYGGTVYGGETYGGMGYGGPARNP